MVLFQSMFSAFLFLEQRFDDDFADRLSYFYTSLILMMMAVLVSFKQFGGRPLECWVPAQFKESWEAYAEMYCWAQNTYWVPFHEEIPSEPKERSRRQISYYQWVPFFLLIEAFMFYFPCLLWRLLNGLSGIRLHDIVSVFREKENIDPEVRSRTISAVARHVEYALRFQHTLQSGGGLSMHKFLKCFNIRYYEAYVTWLYLLMKFVYLVNVIGNLMLMNKFLQTDDYNLYGLGVVLDLFRGTEWKESGNFPRVTLCDFRIRIMGQIQQHTVQCVLVINIFIEKIFIFLWLWFSLLSAVTLIDLIYWCGVSLKQQDRLDFMLRNLHLSAASGGTVHPDRDQVCHFVQDYIKVDGILVLRMVSVHVGSMCCTELAKALWHRFLLSKGETVVYSGSEEEFSPLPATADTDSSSSTSMGGTVVASRTRNNKDGNCSSSDSMSNGGKSSSPSLVGQVMPLKSLTKQPSDTSALVGGLGGAIGPGDDPSTRRCSEMDSLAGSHESSGTAAEKDQPGSSIKSSTSNPVFSRGTFATPKLPLKKEVEGIQKLDKVERAPHYFQPFFS